MLSLDKTATPLPKALSGISGFDSITLGGLPAGRPTLVCGSAGSGKTLFATTFLVNGATQFGEPGVFMSFEERAEDLAANVASLGFDLGMLVENGRLVVDHVRVERSEIEEAGDYDLEGLFVRLGYAVDSIGAKRVVLDTIETLFAGFSNEALLRSELRRLFNWLKDRNLTAVITAERGNGQLTRQGLEEYVSDCVILLDNRVENEIATRRLLVVKYRGSAHGSNEYPFLIDEQGISILPGTLPRMPRRASSDAVSSGVVGLDAMLGAGGFFLGSSILLSGMAGTGKTTFGVHFAEAACARGERCLFFVFEESTEEACRNAATVGIDLRGRLDGGRLRMVAARPSVYGLEMHLARMCRDVDQFMPDVVVVDPISAFRGPRVEVHAVLLRMIDMLKDHGITAMFTNLQTLTADQDTDMGLSSLMDVWVELRNIEADGERSDELYVTKARGMPHSRQKSSYRITDCGIKLGKPGVTSPNQGFPA